MNKKYKEASLGNPLIFSFIILLNEQFNWKNSFFYEFTGRSSSIISVYMIFHNFEV